MLMPPMHKQLRTWNLGPHDQNAKIVQLTGGIIDVNRLSITFLSSTKFLPGLEHDNSFADLVVTPSSRGIYVIYVYNCI